MSIVLMLLCCAVLCKVVVVVEERPTIARQVWMGFSTRLVGFCSRSRHQPADVWAPKTLAWLADNTGFTGTVNMQPPQRLHEAGLVWPNLSPQGGFECMC